MHVVNNIQRHLVYIIVDNNYNDYDDNRNVYGVCIQLYVFDIEILLKIEDVLFSDIFDIRDTAKK